MPPQMRIPDPIHYTPHLPWPPDACPAHAGKAEELPGVYLDCQGLSRVMQLFLVAVTVQGSKAGLHVHKGGRGPSSCSVLDSRERQ